MRNPGAAARGKTLGLCVAVLFGLGLSLTLVSACRARPLASAASILSARSALRAEGAVTPLPIVRQMLGQVDRSRALADLRRLTGEEPICNGSDCHVVANRLTGSEGARWATEYVYRSLAGLGYAVEYQDWTRAGRSDRNVIARKRGVSAPGEEIYFLAHVDGVQPGPGERYPAADDDGCGTAGNLELARVLSRYAFSRTVVLLFTTGEENGTLGVDSFLAQLSPEERDAIKAAVDVDMTGYDGNGDDVMELWHGGEPSSIAVTQIMSETIRAYQLKLVPKFIVGCG